MLIGRMPDSPMERSGIGMHCELRKLQKSRAVRAYVQERITMAKPQTTSQKEALNIVPPLRTYQLTEQKYRDIHSSAWALLIVGCILLYITLVQLLRMLDNHRLFPQLLFFFLSLAASLALLILGRRSLRYSQELKVQSEKDRQLANELVEWFITTYSRDQIDHQIDAITSLGDTPEILCLKRLDMIRILITREYSRSFDEEFLDQLCEDLYNMLFEENLI